MKKNNLLGLGALSLAGVLALTGCSVSQKDGEAWAKANGYSVTLTDAQKAAWATENGYAKLEDMPVLNVLFSYDDFTVNKGKTVFKVNFSEGDEMEFGTDVGVFVALYTNEEAGVYSGKASGVSKISLYDKDFKLMGESSFDAENSVAQIYGTKEDATYIGFVYVVIESTVSQHVHVFMGDC